MAKKFATDVELIINATVDGVDIVLTGGIIYKLMELYNTVDKFYFIVDVKNGTGHYIATSTLEVLSITKWNLKKFKNVLSGVEQSVEFKILTESELFPVLDSLRSNQIFLTGLINVNNERFVREAGERAYRQTLYLNSKRGWSYSINADPNIKRHNVEQAYRRILKRR